MAGKSEAARAARRWNEAMPTSIAVPHTPHPHVEVIESRSGAILYNPFLWLGERFGMARRRRELLAEARGEVLEIGAGTGLNLPHYPAELDHLVLTEPGLMLADRIDLTRAPAGVPTDLGNAPAEYLPFADDSFDTVVSTLVLCTVSDPRRAVAEAARVLRPGGRLLFLEHVRAEPGIRRSLQDRFANPWASFADGCRCDRDTLATIEAQLPVESLDRATWHGMPGIVKPLIRGRAVAS
jgi:SAM-dependent methyltransferase